MLKDLYPEYTNNYSKILIIRKQTQFFLKNEQKFYKYMHQRKHINGK